MDFSFLLHCGPFIGDVRLVADSLSLWFMAIICLVFGCGLAYGIGYMKHYGEYRPHVRLHWVHYAVCFLSMLALCVVRNTLAFLVCWEIMALSSFMLIIFESWRKEVVEAGINFFIQSHISVALLSVGFIAIAHQTGSYDFENIAKYNGSAWPIVLILAGFAVKAGFVPFHTWLPKAHPAAPAHISGVMSGVIIKIGIYGILRTISLTTIDLEAAGYVILAVSAVSALYGVMLAIMQHNLKRLLAYHSIENIGIIGMGIGIGCIGAGTANPYIATAGFAGALLHTLNHALFKSSLFFTAGNVYQATHTLNVEKLGGLAKRLPVTALFFLLSSVAICGLPPMNGFISEMSVYLGMFRWLGTADAAGAVGAAFAIIALVLVGGLAILCFTKAFGIVFLGTPRTDIPPAKEFGWSRHWPLALSAAVMLSIGLFPQLYVNLAAGAIDCFPGTASDTMDVARWTVGVSRAAIAAVGLIALLFAVRALANRGKKVREGETWGCGYTAPTSRIQYTATSYTRTYAELFSGILGGGNRGDEIQGVFPDEASFESDSYDALERNFIEKPLNGYRRFMDKFSFLQNGHLQYYILYGIVCIVLAVVLTLIFA
ncbi:MAG: hypothetical protein HUJ91_01435 [Bacteroidales bacterium]|nr:hypothetical protein [Bacteroidales bacterium]